MHGSVCKRKQKAILCVIIFSIVSDNISNFLYEILREAFILPMYFFIGHISKENRASRTKTIIIIGTIMYAVMFVLLFVFIRPLLSVMAVEKIFLVRL